MKQKAREDRQKQFNYIFFLPKFFYKLEKEMTMECDLLRINPSTIQKPTQNGKSYFVKGDFLYYHYRCDNVNDVVRKTLVE